MVAVRHSLVVGQSLASGSDGNPPVSTDPQTNARLHRLMPDGTLAPLSNATAPDPTVQWPERTLGERAWPGGSYEFAIHTAALGGQGYLNMKRGTASYQNALNVIAAGFNNAVGAGNTFDTRALHIIHGEFDNGNVSAATYEGYLNEWLATYDEDIAAITGQALNSMIGIVCQLGSARVSTSAIGQLAFHYNNPKGYLCAPKYQLQYGAAPHLTNAGYYHLGELHGRVHRKVVIDGSPWDPTCPLWIARTTLHEVQAKFNVPVAPLVHDTSLGVISNWGFSLFDSAGNYAMSSVAISGGDTMIFTLADPLPSGGHDLTLRYGYDVASSGKGNLRDSSPDVSALDAWPLYNWAVQFQLSVPFGPVPTTPPLVPTAARGALPAARGVLV